MSEKTAGELLKEQLIRERKNGFLELDDAECNKAYDFCEGYKAYLDEAKTEREAVTESIRMAEAAGFVPMEKGKKYAPGDKIYYNNRDKSLILAVIGQEPVKKGVRIAVAHIDSPRLDLKPRPLYEDSELALLKTHYYGGIKKYQWGTVPLSLHGVIVKADGTSVQVRIGDDPSEPVFVVNDLLIHLADEQMKRTAATALKGEEMNVLIGSRPFRDDAVSEKVKLNILNLLFEKYGICEEDFLSAELCLVPAYSARDLGLDKSMIGSYAHDDRVCAYPALMAILDLKEVPPCTAVTILTDKEEIGSDGNTGLHSAYLPNFVADLAEPYGIPARWVLTASECLSADVNAAFDPTFPSVMEKNNCAYLNKGVVITKYTGARGKSSTSDASAEFMGRIRRMLDREGVIWQIGELGAVDAGGGGTVAKYVAELDVDVVDLGVPVLSMHAPFETVSKLDVFMAYRAFKALFEDQ